MNISKQLLMNHSNGLRAQLEKLQEEKREFLSQSAAKDQEIKKLEIKLLECQSEMDRLAQIK